MDKSELIKRITDILKVNGCFSVGELDGVTVGVVVTVGVGVGIILQYSQTE